MPQSIDLANTDALWLNRLRRNIDHQRASPVERWHMATSQTVTMDSTGKKLPVSIPEFRKAWLHFMRIWSSPIARPAC